jgi:hypothetical protein
MLQLLHPFIMLHAGMGTGSLLLFAFDNYRSCPRAGLLQVLPIIILAKSLAACFGLGDVTVFGPFRKDDDQLCFLIDNSMCPIVFTELHGEYRRLTPLSNFWLAFC